MIFDLVKCDSNMTNPRIGVQIPTEDRDLLDIVCKARGEDLSDFVRRAIRRELASLGYYTDDVRKALGMMEER